eukprot:TRINITY_DN17921_c0_g1_i1.p1 TRINITY_DN17921_c0_g1~~TRINITY_DN17921_c0_g1_i1.p1  ORF type:complete len:308 (-),score=38.35 TRINITY_DN17921_c0_g1_i1:140-1063(-)
MALYTEAGNNADTEVPKSLAHTSWRLNDISFGARTNASSWTQMLAYVLCEHPRSVVARSGDDLCKGVSDKDQTVKDVNPFKDDNSLPPPQLRARIAGRTGRWYITPLSNKTSSLPTCEWGDSKDVKHPAWTAGVADREINAQSVEEQELAESIHTCMMNLTYVNNMTSSGVALYERIVFSTPRDNFGTVDDIATALSQKIDRAVWNVDEPPEPASRIELFLSVLATLFQDWVLLGYAIRLQKRDGTQPNKIKKKLMDMGREKGRAKLAFMTLVELASVGNLIALAGRKSWAAAGVPPPSGTSCRCNR